MGKKDARVDAYIEGSAPFARPILKHLRKVVHAGCPEVVETLKWSFPHFMYKGILANMAAFKEHCSFGFWKGELLAARHAGIAAKQEEAMGHFGRLAKLSDLPGQAVLIKLVKAAATLNDSGAKLPSRSRQNRKPPLKVPAFFLDALRKNRKAQATFEAFSPSHKREYVEWVTEAKTDETRTRRLDTSIAWLAEGKPRNWKYAAK
jgi:uncharacterized protein YdeI (YjbR/CyaY-like superfamily)